MTECSESDNGPFSLIAFRTAPAIARHALAVSPKVIAFKPQLPEEDEDEAFIELKKKVRHAMAILEEGKAVAAFNLLKQIVGD